MSATTELQNFGDMITFVKNQLRDDTYYTDNEIKMRLNQAQLIINKLLKYVTKDTTITSVKDQQEYDFPSTILIDIDNITYNNIGLEPVDFNHVIQNYEEGGSESESGTPGGYYRRGSKIGLDPKPNESGKTIKLYGTGYTTSMVDNSDTGDLPKYTYLCMCYCALWLLRMKDEESDWKNYYNLYYSELQMVKMIADGNQPNYVH